MTSGEYFLHLYEKAKWLTEITEESYGIDMKEKIQIDSARLRSKSSECQTGKVQVPVEFSVTGLKTLAQYTVQLKTNWIDASRRIRYPCNSYWENSNLYRKVENVNMEYNFRPITHLSHFCRCLSWRTLQIFGSK